MMILAVFIAFAALIVPDQRVSSAVEAFIGSRMHAAQHETRYVGVPRELAALASGVTVRVIDEPRAVFRGRMNLGVELIQPSGAARRCILGIMLRTFDTVAVAVSMIDRHEELQASRIAMQYFETTQLNGDPVTARERLAGMRSRQIIGAGKIVMRSMIEPLPLIASGAAVTVRVKADNVTVSTRGKARTDGWTGGTIDVDVAGLRRHTVKARVIDPSTVEITD